jgi:hypothetical protein
MPLAHDATMGVLATTAPHVGYMRGSAAIRGGLVAGEGHSLGVAAQ